MKPELSNTVPTVSRIIWRLSTICRHYYTKVLGLKIDNKINWKNHFEHMIPKINGACHAVRSMVHISKSNTDKSIYYVYFCSVINYGIISWGYSFNNGKDFT